jgi:hypothetical protein
LAQTPAIKPDTATPSSNRRRDSCCERNIFDSLFK